MTPTIVIQEPLENVTETPGVEIATIWTMRLDTIVAPSFRMSIDVLMEEGRETVRANTYLSLHVTLGKLLSEDFIGIFREFGLELCFVSCRRVKARDSLKNEHFLNRGISHYNITSCLDHVLGGNIDLLLEEFQAGGGGSVQVCYVSAGSLKDSITVVLFGGTLQRCFYEV